MNKLKVYLSSPLSIFFLMVFISIISFTITFRAKSKYVLSNLKKTIVIDAGHGGIDSGTNRGNIKEKDINLAIAKELNDYFKERENIKTIMTRINDELYKHDRNKDIVHRVKLVKKNKADILVSIHVNSFPSNKSFGGQTFYAPDSIESKSLAEFIQKKLIEIQPENYRQIKEGPYYILKKAEVPAVIVEVGFISNPADCKRITTPNEQKIIAKAIGEGIIDYFNSTLDLKSKTNTTIDVNTTLPPQLNLYYCSYDHNYIEKLSTEKIPLDGFKVSNINNSNYTEEVATILLKKLLAGPSNKNHIKLIAPSTKILGLNIKDNIAYVNFSNELDQNTYGGGTQVLKVHSIIKTLTQLPTIKDVKIFIEGDEFRIDN